MPVSINDLQPKPFKVTIKGVELESKPLRLSHALILAKVGNTFQNASQATKQDIKQAETDLDELVSEIIPELSGTSLDVSSVMELINQLMEHIQPADNKELQDKGVSFEADPKA